MPIEFIVYYYTKRFCSCNLVHLSIVRFILIVGEAVRVFSLCLDPISMNSVLVMFKVSLFACSQLKTFARSSFRQNWTFSRLLPVYVRCVSSAYILSLQFDEQFGRSLIYNNNNNGPRMAPWGTLHVNEQLLDSDPFREHFCVRFSKYDWNHVAFWKHTAPGNPKFRQSH